MSSMPKYVHDSDLTLELMLGYFDTLFENNLPLCSANRVEAARLAVKSIKKMYQKLDRYFLAELNDAANAAAKEQ